MTLNDEKLLDETGKEILKILQTEARISFSELGRRVKLTSPAAAERVRKMEDAGIITGYHTQINQEKVGWQLTAIVQLITSPDKYTEIIRLVNDLPEVLECHHVTGNCSFVMKIIAGSISDLEELIKKLSQYGQTMTSIVLSTPVKGKTITIRED